MTVLKRFGPGDPGLLSFPLAGWTLALDFPARTPGLGGLLDGLDRLVADGGGRVYLAKDSHVPPDVLAQMYPRLRSSARCGPSWTRTECWPPTCPVGWVYKAHTRLPAPARRSGRRAPGPPGRAPPARRGRDGVPP